MTKNILIAQAIGVTLILSACATPPPPPPEPEVVKAPVAQQTCTSLDLLTKVVIPADTKSGTSTTSIESEPEYIFNEETGKTDVYQAPPVERKDTWTKIIKPEQIIYVDADNKEVTDICEFKNEAAVIETSDMPNDGVLNHDVIGQDGSHP